MNADEPDLATIVNLQKNVYLFTTAKNINFQQEIAAFIYDDNGSKRPFSEVKEFVLGIDKEYNQTYLQTEYNAALKSGEHARIWNDIQKRKGLFPNLIYRTAGDERVRDEHNALNFFIRPVDHEFWDTYYPPNGWNCRCYTQQTDKDPNGKDIPKVNDKNVPEIFRQNVGKSGESFPKDHPYFKAISGLKWLKQIEKVKSLISYRASYKAKNGAKVLVHPFADPKDLLGNYRAAIKLADNNKANVKIRYHLVEGKNPEYIINKVVSDRVYPKVDSNLNTSMKNAFKKKFKQIEADDKGIVFDFSNRKELSFVDLKTIARRINARKGDFKMVGIIYNDKSNLLKNISKMDFETILKEVKKISR